MVKTDLNQIQEKMDKAFIAGYAFFCGFNYVKRKITEDSNTNNPHWITTKKGHHVLIDRFGRIQSGRFKNQDIGEYKDCWKSCPIKRISKKNFFTSATIRSFYEEHPELEWKSYKAVCAAYLKNKYKGLILRNPKGLPFVVDLKFTVSGLCETANKLKSGYDWVLDNIPRIYKEGIYIGKTRPDFDTEQEKQKHADVKYIHYTRCILEFNGEIFRVTGNVFEKENGEYEFSHYAVKPIFKIK